MVVRSGTCLRKYILCSLWSGCKPECARSSSSSSSRYPLVAPASNQLLLIVKKSMGEESRCALRATSNGSITACCLAFAGPALMECAQRCLLSLKRTELLFFFLKAIFCPLLVCFSATVCGTSKAKFVLPLHKRSHSWDAHNHISSPSKPHPINLMQRKRPYWNCQVPNLVFVAHNWKCSSLPPLRGRERELPYKAVGCYDVTSHSQQRAGRWYGKAHISYPSEESWLSQALVW